MELYEAKCDDIWIVQSLAKQIWPPTFRDLMSAEQMDYMMNMMYSTDSLEKQMNEQNHKYLLLKEDDEYLGYLSYEVNYKNKPCTKIHKIYVLPSIQGKGLGRFLIEKATEIGKENNCEILSLNVKRDNSALQFYKKMGFEVAGSEDIDIGNGYLMQDYILNKKL